MIAPASTGSDSSSRNAVTSIDHTNSGILCSVMPGARMLKIVVMKLIAPRIDDGAGEVQRRRAPCPCRRARMLVGRVRTAADRASSRCRRPSPDEQAEPISSENAGTSSQKLMLFRRGKAMSGAPIISGTNQLPKPPISRRHDREEDHDQAVRRDDRVPDLAVGDELRCPGCISSARMITDSDAADQPAHDREDQVERADVLVVGAEQPARDEARPVVGVLGVVGVHACRGNSC